MSHKQYLESLVRESSRIAENPQISETQKFRLRQRADHEAISYIRSNTKTYCDYLDLLKYYQDLIRR